VTVPRKCKKGTAPVEVPENGDWDLQDLAKNTSLPLSEHPYRLMIEPLALGYRYGAASALKSLGAHSQIISGDKLC